MKKTIIYTGAVAGTILLIWLIINAVTNSGTRKNLEKEKLVSERLLSEKLSYEKDLGKLKSEFDELNRKNEDFKRLLAANEANIVENEKKIKSLAGENRSLKTSKKELEELKKVHIDLQRESSRLKEENDRIATLNKEMQNSITSLETQMTALAQQLENARKFRSENFLSTATRGNNPEKLVIKASRTKKLNIAFEVPGTLTEAISFKILTPAGNVIDEKDKNLTLSFPLRTSHLTASLSSSTGEFEQSRQVILNYAPKEKLSKGEYQIQIMSGENRIGTCRIQLK
ncbi:MAG: hypothetical protein MUE32_01605 [Bacteroidales bacterium]|jgi:myosin heavy subunit|nr:hypothetical protein [Bacteroidales bacterium]